ncbi:NAD(P)H-hydrate dehydratase [Novosphingobium sp. KCTC 2891]|uniref:NAD(P)H-hydrate dehydratase n=1 Tax=Novosphingobium sp. KCTC 2891 TaxID=2989730 RepID=UPI002222303F|nr:NAD(P)H-hydrate dehydratase [Novosphingobium sp. KCTC 2891]MCW1383103.1 NAD(P)H-hydrate dehydratase [Novosphingobium sp. KCTC 2891]
MADGADLHALDSDWLRAHPLPQPAEDTDKNGRGRVLAIGGCTMVPGGIRLTAEAALRAGAGKVQVATVASAALPLGVTMPEIAVHAMPEAANGELGVCGPALPDLMARADAVIAGPAMSCREAASRLVADLLDVNAKAELVLDAAALMVLPDHADALRRRTRPAVLTPHVGEIAAMLDVPADEIVADRVAAVRRAADRFGAICVLKGATSLVAAPDAAVLAFAGGGVGLATGGSGDVLAGIAAGLAARGAPPLEATAWAVWLHGEAGRRCAEQMGPLGFLARELLAHVPGLMRAL